MPDSNRARLRDTLERLPVSRSSVVGQRVRPDRHLRLQQGSDKGESVSLCRWPYRPVWPSKNATDIGEMGCEMLDNQAPLWQLGW
ncbi:Carboxylic ester hydrolase [Pseudozyma hubeiensis]|nr:Carboxylic ester hydrolase [Pseudozyma hubeiensis]